MRCDDDTTSIGTMEERTLANANSRMDYATDFRELRDHFVSYVGATEMRTIANANGGYGRRRNVEQ